VVAGDHLVACFTYQNESSQSVALAFSSDGGRTFLERRAKSGFDERAPRFPRPQSISLARRWRLIIAAGPHAQLFASTDLRAWTLLSEIPAPHPGWVWECPDLFFLDEKWVLLASFIVPGAPHQTHFWLGDFDGTRFTPQSGSKRLSLAPTITRRFVGKRAGWSPRSHRLDECVGLCRPNSQLKTRDFAAR
jgi:levanase/fructan beta-fructosidase